MARNYVGNGEIYSGAYIPTVELVSNLDAVTTYKCQYIKVGNIVTVSGGFSINATTVNVSAQFKVSLPIALAVSAFARGSSCGGTFSFGASASTNNVYGQIRGQDTSAEFTYMPVAASTHVIFFQFTYDING